MPTEKVDREGLNNLLLNKGAKPARVATAIRELEPYFQKIEAGLYDFIPKEEVDQEELERVIYLATRRKVMKFEFISVSDPETEPEWLAEHPWDRPLLYTLGDCMPIIFRGPGNHLPWGPNKFRYAYQNAFFNHLEYCINIKSQYRGNCYKLKDDLTSDLWRVFEYLINFTIDDYQYGPPEEELLPIIRTLAKVHPLCDRPDEPGTWPILVG